MKPRASLLRHANFLRFWSANIISDFGSGITFLALPIIAAVSLEASPSQMGLLGAAGTLPYLLFGLPIGVFVDAHRKRPLLITADVGRLILIATLPLAALLWQLTWPHLLLVTFLGGCLTLLADVAEEAFLPGLISRENLVEGYSKLSASNSIIELSGPAVAATLIELLTAPIALIMDAASFLLSSILLGTIKLDESAPEPMEERPSLWQQIRQGLSYIRHHAQLRPMLLNNSSMQLFGGMIDALLILYLLQLGLPATFVGVIFAVGSLTGLAAAAWGKRAAQRLGLGRMVVLGSLLISIGALARPFAFGTPFLAGAILLLGQTVQGFGNTVYNIGYDSLSQTVTPDELLGRVNATGLFVGFGALPIGALLGGFFGEWWGLRTAVAISSTGLLLSVLWVYFSPLRLSSTSFKG
ncbi:MAG: MFS transporter [Ardenticatenaceae bacterium]|nr:MFS transporter [Ardenticatenaceae bacterium]